MPQDAVSSIKIKKELLFSGFFSSYTTRYSQIKVNCESTNLTFISLKCCVILAINWTLVRWPVWLVISLEWLRAAIHLLTYCWTCWTNSLVDVAGVEEEYAWVGHLKGKIIDQELWELSGKLISLLVSYFQPYKLSVLDYLPQQPGASLKWRTEWK